VLANTAYLWAMRMEDTICALSTAPGQGAIALIRVSGPQTKAVINKVFRPRSARHELEKARAYQNLVGYLLRDKEIIDEVVVAWYQGPQSYTGEDVAEIACHGSPYVTEQILRSLLAAGARLADPGEYTLRAYINGKMDLSQAEAVADLIAAENQAAHKVAMQQLRGGISAEIRQLREELINFVALIELELDFSEEDVEFADRAALESLLARIEEVLRHLLDSYSTGNAIKNGVPVAIVGAPNAGKSTLLNALLNEEKAIVTEVAGTTRDAIEDEITLDGIRYRFIDTAGIRETEDQVEKIGIQRTFEKIALSDVVLFLFDAYAARLPERQALLAEEIALLRQHTEGKTLLILGNKTDRLEAEGLAPWQPPGEAVVWVSAQPKKGLEALREKLQEKYRWQDLAAQQSIVTSARHVNALEQSLADIQKVKEGLAAGLSGDLLSLDIREALQHLGSIIGEVDVDKDILGAIFGKFCIGK